MGSIGHNKAHQIKRVFNSIIGISNWESLSIEHDNIDHQLDLTLLKIIKEIESELDFKPSQQQQQQQQPSQQKRQQPQPQQQEQQEQQESPQNEENKLLLVINREIQHSTINNGGSGICSYSSTSSTTSSTSTSTSSTSTTSTQQKTHNHETPTFKFMNEKFELILNQLISLKPIFKENEGQRQQEQEQQQQQDDQTPIEYNPTITFKLGKEFVLGNLFIDQILNLLEFLYVIALEIENSCQYWETLDYHTFYFQKSPLFWLKFYNQQLNNKIQFSNKFTEIHKLSKPKSIEYLSKGINKINNFFKKQQQPQDEQQQPQQSKQNEQGQQRGEGQQKEEIKHPKLELSNKIEILKSYQVIISVLIGRLTYLLDSIKNNMINSGAAGSGGKISLESFNELMSKSSVIILDTLVLLNKSFNDNDTSSTEEVEEGNKLFNESNNLIKQVISSGGGNGISSNQELNFKLLLNNQIIIKKLIFIKIKKQISKYSIPNYLVRNWFKISIGSMILMISIKYSYDNFDSFKKSAIDTQNALIRFYHEHLEEPLLNIWNVIRYDKKSLDIADPISLQSSIDSLSRMVLDYNLDTDGPNSLLYNNEEERLKLLELVSRGDISSIMKSYESNIKSPIKSILFGDMIRLILIQIQKEKVDVDKAMVAIDKLLQANELNFQLLAAIPSGLFLALLIWQIKRLFTNQKTTLPYSQFIIFKTLRKINRTLILNGTTTSDVNNVDGSGHNLPNFISPLFLNSYNSMIYNNSNIYSNISGSGSSNHIVWGEHNNNNNDQDINNSPQFLMKTQFKPFEKYGTILISTNKLRTHQRFIREQSESQWFNQDVHDLESDYLSNQDKIQTINRMFQTYSFLKTTNLK